MIQLALKLKRNYKLAVLSNSDTEITKRLKEEGIFDPFEVLILSHEIGTIKPEQKIYDIALEKVGHLPEECLLIDDQEATLKRIRKKGNTIALEAANKNYGTKIYASNRIKIQGKLVSLYRNFH